MDLIAIAFANAEVHLYRMSWQRVWSVSCPHQNVTVTSLAWRPDGKILAVAYSSGHFRLLAVEDAKKIFSFNCKEGIQKLYWLQEDEELSKKQESNNFYEDISVNQLPKPISYDMISQLFEKSNNKDFPDNLFIKESKNLTYLVCAYGTSISIFVYGYFLLVDANLDLVPSFLNYKQLKSCYLSDNTALISTLGLTDENLLVYSLLDSRILYENHLQVKMISTKFGMLFSMLSALKGVIKEMEELWEDILVEMDQKFQLYALEKYSNNTNPINNSNKPQNGNANDSSLVNDFMLLYAFGTCSDHFKNFLLQELTDKGLKKLEISVENYYSNIQRLLSGNFHQIALCMFYHLNELYGMTKWSDKFKAFSITEQLINDVLNNCASLILKAQELNSVIEQNMREIKIFFKWLHASIIHLGDDQSATDMIRFNEEMENSILDFIQSTFKDAQTINMEKVGQYLKHDNLKAQINEENSWQSFLKTKLTHKENQYLYLNKREKSLIGCFEEFKQTLNDCFKSQAISSQQPFSFIKQYNIHKFNSTQDADEMLMSYKCIQNTMITGLLMAKANNECYILKHSVSSDPEVKAYILNLSSHTIDLSQISLQDVYIYGENSVTLLGTDNKTSSNTYLIQLSLQTTPTSSSSDLIEVTSYSENVKSPRETNLLMIKAEKLSATSIVKCIKKLKSSCLCVSSSRKVAALLSSHRNRVKIFELEVDDDDDEIMEENDTDSLADNEDQVNPIEAYQSKGFNNSYQASDVDEFNMPNAKPSDNPKSSIVYKQFTKHQSAGSTCSIANSICSSTAATMGSASTAVNFDANSTASSAVRGKRKKNFDYDEDDDEDLESEENFINDTNEISSFLNGKQTNGLVIGANQNGNQNMNLQKDNQPETF